MGTPQTHILVVDDSEDDRGMYAYYLSQKGYRVSKARDGREGQEKAIELQPNLILMDLWLPILSGWQVIQNLKVDDRTKNIPILVITGHSFVRPLGCEGSLTKPFPLDQLGKEITKVLQSTAKVEKAEKSEKAEKVEELSTRPVPRRRVKT
jgi:two-component system, cell cycle response regulator DivK